LDAFVRRVVVDGYESFGVGETLWQYDHLLQRDEPHLRTGEDAMSLLPKRRLMLDCKDDFDPIGRPLALDRREFEAERKGDLQTVSEKFQGYTFGRAFLQPIPPLRKLVESATHWTNDRLRAVYATKAWPLREYIVFNSRGAVQELISVGLRENNRRQGLQLLAAPHLLARQQAVTAAAFAVAMARQQAAAATATAAAVSTSSFSRPLTPLVSVGGLRAGSLVERGYARRISNVAVAAISGLTPMDDLKTYLQWDMKTSPDAACLERCMSLFRAASDAQHYLIDDPANVLWRNDQLLTPVLNIAEHVVFQTRDTPVSARLLS
jgi:hypothetical protein